MEIQFCKIKKQFSKVEMQYCKIGTQFCKIVSSYCKMGIQFCAIELQFCNLVSAYCKMVWPDDRSRTAVGGMANKILLALLRLLIIMPPASVMLIIS